MTFTVVLKDSQSQPNSGAVVKFLLSVDFFAHGLMEIGEAVTNEQGVSALQYLPRWSGETQVIARYETIETGGAKLSIADTGKVFYHTQAGIPLPSLGPEVFIGPKSALELGELGYAPMPALRLPGGALSLLWLFVAVLVLVWGTYLVALRQVFHISMVKQVTTANTRLVPQIGLAIVVLLGVMTVFMFITGPFSHFHLLR